MIFCLIVQRIFECNQEAKTEMIKYITKFDLSNKNIQHIPTAALRIRAILCALGNGVPSNVVYCVLDGMKYASKIFVKCMCETNSALLSNTLYHSTVKILLPQKHIFSILQDLEAKYLKLVEYKDWDGC